MYTEYIEMYTEYIEMYTKYIEMYTEYKDIMIIQGCIQDILILSFLETTHSIAYAKVA